ncbi:hypothetical protein [Nocardia arthritidis]|uniref:Head-to-tail stopper n=1 Tax=Nocardia arthritidis TaxID=228602 RepID=A0A6G9YTG5_9NOCA|nr:hypothetical protein [Nocardia arthritidis]QIS16494.1 hypothetical protein F5544_43450 [Nocardia arthritidis]
MGIFPTPYTVQTRRFRQGPEKDPRGSLVKKWDAPAVQPVIAIGPKERFTEPAVSGYDRVVIRREIFVPPEFIAGPWDKLIIPAHRNEPELEYEVQGYPEDYNDGPWAFQPGLVVRVTRAEG